MPNQDDLKDVSPSAEMEGVGIVPDEEGKAEAKTEADPDDQLGWRRKDLENQSLYSDIKAREKYADSLFQLVSWWLSAILMILLFQGFYGKDGATLDWYIWDAGPHFHTVLRFNLETEVMLALIGGTTASILALFTFVVQYLFPKPDSKSK